MLPEMKVALRVCQNLGKYKTDEAGFPIKLKI